MQYNPLRLRELQRLERAAVVHMFHDWTRSVRATAFALDLAEATVRADLAAYERFVSHQGGVPWADLLAETGGRCPR